MSDTQAPPLAPRRSQRDRKAVQPFASASFTGKRKRNGSDTEGDAHPDTEGDQSETDGEGDNDDGNDDPLASKSKDSLAKASKSKASPKAKLAKKSRTEKASTPKPPKVTTRRGRKVKEGEVTYDAEQVAKDTKISADNPLFNSIMNPASPLQSSAEDFLEALQQSEGAALAELINLVLRSCGCNDSVDADQALDFDGIVSTLDDFTESLKQENSPVYPLTSKLPVFRRFRKSLAEWIERLIISASDLGILYSTQLMETLQQWVVSMSSSQIRSFRHTATVIALEAETALCDVAAATDKEAEVVTRQREGEKKRKGAKGGNARLKELETKSQSIKGTQNKLKAYIKEFVDGVFVHRFRDLDPNIRAECVRALGLWLRKYPEHFLDAHYLRYVGWVLSDVNNHVRLEAVKALSGVYNQAEYIPSLTLFTERFRTRLLEMATSDVDISIRVAVIHVLSDIETHFPLEEEQKERLCLLLFDEEARVRKAVSPLVQAVWEEEVEEQVNRQHRLTDKDKERIGFKVLASLLVKWGKALDALVGDTGESEIGDDDARDAEDIINDRSRRTNRRRDVVGLIGVEDGGRVALAVEALWDHVEPIGDWNALLELLLLDHSPSEDDSQLPSLPKPKGRANGKKQSDDFVVDDAWRLEENEESILLEVMVAAIRRAKEESASGKKGEEENVSNDITRALIKGLPRLFIKHQSDQNRIAEVLIIPTLMNLDLYLEMRMIAAYSTLWDDIIKQFMSHSSAKVLSHAMGAIRYFMEATSLSNTNSTKILELEDELSTQLRDTIAGRDEIEVTSFSEDEVITLSAWCTRLAVLSGTRNMTSWVEEDEGGKQSSAWDIINAIVERGRLGLKEEESMVEQALNTLMLHVLWKTKGLPADADPPPEDLRYEAVLREQRGSLLEKLVEYAIGTQSNVVEGVRRVAFKHLIDLHILFSPTNAHSPDGTVHPLAPLSLTLDDETQYRCAGYIQAEIERYADFLDNNVDDAASQKSGDDGSDEDGETGDNVNRLTKSRSTRQKQREVDFNSRDALEREYLFIDVISTFLRAIRAGTINVQHGAVVLAHYGRLELAFDTCSKVVIDVLREERIMKDIPEVIVATLTRAIQEAYTLVLDGIVHDETNAVQLAKLAAGCFVVRGSQLAVLRRLPAEYILQTQTNLLSWIVKKITAYENNKNKKSLKAAIAFFRVLVPLLGPIQSRDALKLKAYMDQIFAEAKIEITQSSKQWEPERAYEKRLSAIMAKDSTQPTKGKRTRKKIGVGASSGEDTEGEHTQDEAVRERPRPRPRRATRRNPVAEEGADENTSQDEENPITPKASKTAEARDVPQAEHEEREDSPMQSLTPSELQEPNENMTPKAPKRRREEEKEEEAAPAPNGSGGFDTEAVDIPDIQVRRKRIRH